MRVVTVVLVALVAVASCASSAAAWGSGLGQRESSSVAYRDRDSQIRFWEDQLLELKSERKERVVSDLYRASAALDDAKKHSSWFFPSSEEKARLKLLEDEVLLTGKELEALKREEQLIVGKLKPLYGIVSYQFMQEQKQKIGESIQAVQRVSYDNAWYSSLFKIGEADGLVDLAVGFLIEWLMGYVALYPFALLYYALWEAPWSVFSFMSGPADVFTALVAWAGSVIVMALPLAALGGGLFLVHKFYGENLRAAARENARRRYTR